MAKSSKRGDSSKVVRDWDWYCKNPDKWVECPECGSPDEPHQHAQPCSRYVAPEWMKRPGRGLENVKPNPLAGILLSWPEPDRSALGFDH